MASATDESNEKHTAPWSEACQRDGVFATPLTPYIDQVGVWGGGRGEICVHLTIIAKCPCKSIVQHQFFEYN